MENEPELELEDSPYSKKIEKNGKVVSVEIYRVVGDDDWQLEVVDEFNNSTVWIELFDSDEKAFAEVEKTVALEGIESLIGKPTNNVN